MMIATRPPPNPSAREVDVNTDQPLTIAAIARPGDHLIVGVNHSLSLDEMEELRSGFAEHLPGLKVAVVDDCAGLQVYRPGDQAQAVEPAP